MENGKYTTKEAAKVLRKEPRDISYRIKKGGIKELHVEETDEGFQYLLTEKSIDQLGALFGVVPDYSLLQQETTTPKKTRSQEMVEFDGSQFSKELKAKGVTSQTVSRAIGAGDTYIHDAIRRNRISKANLEKVEHIFGISASKFITSKQEKDPEVTKTPKPEIDVEAIRSAVYNGFMDALLMFMKEDTIYKILIRLAEDERFVNAIQKPIFLAVNGVRILSERDEQQNNGKLVPQNGVRR